MSQSCNGDCSACASKCEQDKTDFREPQNAMSDIKNAMKRMIDAVLSEDPSLPIREICLSCGYASLNTFYKAFQRAYATAPNAMRKKAKEGSP